MYSSWHPNNLNSLRGKDQVCFLSSMVYFDIIHKGASHYSKHFYMYYLLVLTTLWGRYYYPYIMGKKLKSRKVKKLVTQVVGFTPQTSISLFCFIVLST